jgi:hypothetical protein
MSVIKISKRKLWIGVISSLLFIILKLLNGLSDYHVATDKTYDTAKQLIFTIAHFYLYISILFLLKNVLIDFYHQEFLRKNMSWIIRLTAISAALSILIALGFGKYLAIIFLILAFIELFFYIRFFGDVMLIDVHSIPTISQLQWFVKALLISMLFLVLISVVMKYGGMPETKYLNQIFLAIPFIFIGMFFYKTLKYS